MKAEPAAPPSAPSPPPAPEPAKETPPTPPSSIPTPAPAPVEPSTEQIPHHVWQRPIIQVLNSASFLEIFKKKCIFIIYLTRSSDQCSKDFFLFTQL